MSLARLAGCVVATLTLAPAPAEAQDVDGVVRVAFGAALVEHARTQLEFERPNLLGETNLALSHTEWGSEAPSVFIDVGYGLSNWVVLGAFVQIGGASFRLQSGASGLADDACACLLVVGPRAEIVFAPGSEVRPFAAASVGFAAVSAEAGENRASLRGLELTGELGLHWFAATGVSLDPAVQVGWGIASGDLDAFGEQIELRATTWNLALALSVSGWIG